MARARFRYRLAGDRGSQELRDAFLSVGDGARGGGFGAVGRGGRFHRAEGCGGDSLNDCVRVACWRAKRVPKSGRQSCTSELGFRCCCRRFCVALDLPRRVPTIVCTFVVEAFYFNEAWLLLAVPKIRGYLAARQMGAIRSSSSRDC